MNLIPFDTRGAWSRYTTADGLGSQQTEHIVEDADGYLWIATISGGVCRFDGESFRTYTTRDGLPSDDVYALCIDRFGRLWCGTLAGLCWLDGERFRPAEAVPAMHVNFLFEDSRGWLWTGGGFDGTCFGFWDGESYTDLSKDYESTTGSGGGACWGLCEDQDGAVWLAARHVARWDGGTLEHIDLPHHHNHTIAAHPGGGVWHASGGSIGTWRDGTYESLEIPLASSVRKILPDRQGRVWFCLTATGQDAPVALLADGQSFLQVAASQVGFNYVNAMHEDREGALWFATWGGGVTRFDPAGPFVLDTADGLPSKQVARVAEDAHRRLWVQFSDPMVSNKEWPVGYLADDCFVALPDTEQYQTDLLVTGDGIWLTGKGGLCRWALDSLKPVDVVLGSETRRRYTGCLSRDSQGRLLLGYSDRPPEGVDTLVIACFDAGETQTLLEVATPGRLVAAIGCLAPTADGIWLGVGAVTGQGEGYGIGFLHLDGRLTWYAPEDGLVHACVEALLVDRDGILWVATLGGVSRFDRTTFTNYTTADGLPHNHVRSIAEDEGGGLWFGTDAGVARFDGTAFNVIGLQTGSPIRSITHDHTGRWWFATMEGLVGYRPSRVPPRVRIVQSLADRVYDGAEAVNVTTSVRQVVFEFTGMSFRTPAADMLYRYRLDGDRHEWSPASRERRAVYQDLPPGDYTFQVCAIDRDLNTSEPAEVAVHVVHDPRDARIDELERRVQQRTRELQERNHDLEVANRQVEQTSANKSQFLRRMSHDLRSPMNAIIGYTRLLQRRLADRMDAREARNLANIGTSSGNLLNLINDILDLSRIEAGHIEVNKQPVDVRALIDECADSLGSIVKQGVSLNRDLAAVGQIPSDVDRLRQVIMNLLGNATKFTDSGSITLSLKRDGDAVALSVADTGIGIPPDDLPHIFDEFRQVERQGGEQSEGTGLGLAIAKRTVDLLGGEISADSQAGEGATFTVRLPA